MTTSLQSALAHASAATVHLKALQGEQDEFKAKMLFVMAQSELEQAAAFLEEWAVGRRLKAGLEERLFGTDAGALGGVLRPFLIP